MKRKHPMQGHVLALLCIVCILSYIFVAFFPHAHSYCDNDCALCAILQSSRELWSVLSLTVLLFAIGTASTLARVIHALFPARSMSLVRLKVKLSD